ncbi:MAG: AI-2E family transporter [Candidatus Magasanikbacteria bacterium]
MSKKNKISFGKVQSIFFFSLIGILSIAMIYLVFPFLYPIFWAAIIAILFYPVYSWLEDYIKSEILSSLLTILLIIASVFIPLVLIAILILNQSIELYSTIVSGNYIEELTKLVELVKDTPLEPYITEAQKNLVESATNIARTATLTLFESARQITSTSIRFVAQFLIMLYTLFYFLKDGPKILGRLMYLSPLGDKYEKKLFEEFTSTANATLKSTLIIGSIQGAIGGVLFWWVGIKGYLIWTLVMILLTAIPTVGASLVIFIAALILLAMGDITNGVILLVGTGINSTIDNLLRPELVGKDIQMHPLLVLFTTLGGILLFGVSGFIIGPIIASLFRAVIAIYSYYYETELKHN